MSLASLSAAVAGTTKEGNANSTSFRTSTAQNSSQNEVQLELQRLAAAVAACKQSAAEEQLATSNADDPVSRVQEGLHATKRQLERLLQQTHRTPAQQQDQQAPVVPHHAQHGSSKCAVAVLQAILQLAVGDVQLLCGSTADSPWPTAHTAQPSTGNTNSNTLGSTDKTRPAQHTSLTTTSSRDSTTTSTWYPQLPCCSAEQHHGWEEEALNALQLFSLQDLLSEGQPHPGIILHQSLLLRPQLLDQLLEAAAAAVLEPVLPSTQSVAKSNTTISGSGNGSSSSSSRCCSIAAVLAYSKLPLVQLSRTLAANPALMLKACDILLSWLQQTGHQRLWQLTSLILRPAWQALATAAPPTAQMPAISQSSPANPEAVAMCIPAADKSRSVSSDISNNEASEQAGKAANVTLHGAFYLLCPEPWQRQLINILVQEPSEEGLVQLLAVLPCVQLRHRSSELGEPRNDGSQQTAHMHVEANITAVAAEADDDGTDRHSEYSLCSGWPSLQEWNGASRWLPAEQLELTEQHKQHQQRERLPEAAAPAADAGCATPAQGGDLLMVLEAWRLVVQHRCWQEFACFLIAKHSLAILQGQLQNKCQHQEQHDAGTRSKDMAALQHASMFIAWEQEPTDAAWQLSIQQRLMQSLHSASASLTSTPAPGSASAAPAKALEATAQLKLQCNALLGAWRKSHICSNACSGSACDAQAENCNKHAAVEHSSMPGLQQLLELDLPLAMMQQLQLLLSCTEQALLHMCFANNFKPDLQIHENNSSQSARDQSTGGGNSTAAPGQLEKQAQRKQHRRLQDSRPTEADTSVQSNAAVLCAVCDTVDVIRAAALGSVSSLQAALKSGAQLTEPSVCGQHGHWLARQWMSEFGQMHRVSGEVGTTGNQETGGGESPMQLLGAALKLVKSAAEFDKLLGRCSPCWERL